LIRRGSPAVVEALLFGAQLAAFVVEASLLGGAAGALLFGALLAGGELGADGVIAANAVGVTFGGLVFADDGLGFAQAALVEAADVFGGDGLGANVDVAVLEDFGARTCDPPAIARALIAPDRRGGGQVVVVVVLGVVMTDVVRCDVAIADEAPRIGRHVVDELVVADGRPADRVVAHAPLNPGGSPRRVGVPEPTIVAVEPAAVVVSRPAERIKRDPDPADVAVVPVAVGVGDVARKRGLEHVAVARIVDPRAVRIELIVEVRLVGDRIARRQRDRGFVLGSDDDVVRRRCRHGLVDRVRRGRRIHRCRRASCRRGAARTRCRRFVVERR
jgi:hypothetical protein